MNRPIFFLHITKTGGQTIEHLLAKKYGDGYWQLAHDQDFRAVPEGFDVYAGQVAHYTKHLIHPEPFTFTFVRSPISRLLSFYDFYRKNNHFMVQWIRSEPSIWRHNIKSHLPLAEFLDQPPIRQVAYNRMTRDIGAPEPLIDHVTITDSLINRAIRNMDEMDFVGVFEHFDESLERLSNKIGTDLGYTHMNWNASSRTRVEDLSGRDLERLCEFTYYDKIIYDRADMRFMNER